MNWEQFKESLHYDHPPTEISSALKALWFDGKGDWESAHNIAQDMVGADGSWIHAYLHRKEGDAWNAGYWYRQADREYPQQTLEEEWIRLVQYFSDRL